ncbi:MAG TPA: RNA polymerase sigma-70 factor [Longimicrobiales bacterium]
MDSDKTASALLEELRPNAFAIAYRMLGSVSDAEDIVQESLLRLHTAMQGERIAAPQAYLATVVTRLCIDELRAARTKRERYFGEWLPEPLVDTPADTTARTELAESLGMAFLVMLETLSPEQRAVFLLRDVFDYDYAEVARIVGKSESACRQLAVRARARVLERRPRFEARPEQHEALVARFFAAIEDGELPALEALLAADVSLHGDGGGKVPAMARSLHGRSTIARVLLNWARAGRRAGSYSVRTTSVNGQAGALVMNAEGAVLGVWVIDVADEQIQAIRVILNPDKLRHLAHTADFGDWLRSGVERGK